MLDPDGFADYVKTHWPGIDGVAVPELLGELDAVIVENGVDPIGHGFQQMLEELPGRLSVGCFNELSDGEFGRAVNAHIEIELTFSRLHLGNVDMEEPDGVALELLSLRFVALDVRKTGDDVPLQAPMQRRPG